MGIAAQRQVRTNGLRFSGGALCRRRLQAYPAAPPARNACSGDALLVGCAWPIPQHWDMAPRALHRGVALEAWAGTRLDDLTRVLPDPWTRCVASRVPACSEDDGAADIQGGSDGRFMARDRLRPALLRTKRRSHFGQRERPGRARVAPRAAEVLVRCDGVTGNHDDDLHAGTLQQLASLLQRAAAHVRHVGQRWRCCSRSRAGLRG